SKVSGLKNSPFALVATQLQSFSFDGDFITVLDEKFLNPISEGSTRKYFFLLEDTLYSGKDTVFVISFRPRENKNFDAMKGVLYINTNTYAIQNVIAEPGRKDNTISIKIQQKYEFIEGKQWFPVQLNTDWIWNNAVASNKDSTKKTNLKSVSRTYIKDIVLNPEVKKFKFLEAVITNKIAIGFLNLNLNKILKFNNYESTRLGLGLHTNQKVSKVFTVGGYAGYGFKDKAWKY